MPRREKLALKGDQGPRAREVTTEAKQQLSPRELLVVFEEAAKYPPFLCHNEILQERLSQRLGLSLDTETVREALSRNYNMALWRERFVDQQIVSRVGQQEEDFVLPEEFLHGAAAYSDDSDDGDDDSGGIRTDGQESTVAATVAGMLSAPEEGRWDAGGAGSGMAPPRGMVAG